MALETFEVEYDGQLETIEAGRTQVIEGHEIARKYPRMFGPAPPMGRRRRRPTGLRRGGGHDSATAPSPAGRSNTVRFTENAWAALREEVAECDGLEVGGALFGELEPDGSVVVRGILGPNEWTERGRYRIVMDVGRFRDHEAALSPWLWLGDWHTHDAPTAKPSEGDEKGWAAFVRAKVGLYVGVIATPRDVTDWRWSSPTIRGWVNRREDGVSRCETARIELIERSN